MLNEIRLIELNLISMLITPAPFGRLRRKTIQKEKLTLLRGLFAFA